MLDPRMVATSTQTPTCGAQGFAEVPERITPSSQGAFTKVPMLVRFHVPESGLSVSWWSQNGYPCVSYPSSISCLWNVPEESIVLFLRITKKLEEPEILASIFFIARAKRR